MESKWCTLSGEWGKRLLMKYYYAVVMIIINVIIVHIIILWFILSYHTLARVVIFTRDGVASRLLNKILFGFQANSFVVVIRSGTRSLSLTFVFKRVFIHFDIQIDVEFHFRNCNFVGEGRGDMVTLRMSAIIDIFPQNQLYVVQHFQELIIYTTRDWISLIGSSTSIIMWCGAAFITNWGDSAYGSNSLFENAQIFHCSTYCTGQNSRARIFS